MAKLRVQFESGEAERVIEFDPARAPFQHDGRPGSILDVLLAHGIHLKHACGGNSAGTTCPLVVKKGTVRLSAPGAAAEGPLAKAPGLTPTFLPGCLAAD